MLMYNVKAPPSTEETLLLVCKKNYKALMALKQ